MPRYYMLQNRLFGGIDENTITVSFDAVDENGNTVNVNILFSDISQVDALIEALSAAKKIYIATDEHIDDVSQ